jgi:hypothetical protein
MEYRIVIRDLINKRVTPLTVYFESKEYALKRLEESYTSPLSNHFIYDLEPKEEGDKTMWEVVTFGRMGKEINTNSEFRYITKRQAERAAEELRKSSCYTYEVRQIKQPTKRAP